MLVVPLDTLSQAQVPSCQPTAPGINGSLHALVLMRQQGTSLGRGLLICLLHTTATLFVIFTTSLYAWLCTRTRVLVSIRPSAASRSHHSSLGAWTTPLLVLCYQQVCDANQHCSSDHEPCKLHPECAGQAASACRVVGMQFTQMLASTCSPERQAHAHTHTHTHTHNTFTTRAELATGSSQVYVEHHVARRAPRLCSRGRQPCQRPSIFSSPGLLALLAGQPTPRRRVWTTAPRRAEHRARTLQQHARGRHSELNKQTCVGGPSRVTRRRQ